MGALQPSPKPAAAVAQPAMLPAYDVADLMRGGTQVQMILNGVPYYLRVTRAGKLILTK